MAETRRKNRKAQIRGRTPEEVPLAFLDESFLRSPDARSLRILAEYLEPAARFAAEDVRDTIAVFGSARIPAREDAERALARAEAAGRGVAAARRDLEMSRYYEETRALARRLTEWSKGLGGGRRFVICTGGGPGIMEAANRGAAEARGLNIGLNIALPHEQIGNPYTTRHLTFQFHYFFMRKFWFAYFAKAMVFMPGGFGTLDELFEILTLCQTLKLKKRLPLVLYGSEFWERFFDLGALVEGGTVSREDLDLVRRSDSVDDAFEFLTSELMKGPVDEPGGTLERNIAVKPYV